MKAGLDSISLPVTEVLGSGSIRVDIIRENVNILCGGEEVSSHSMGYARHTSKGEVIHAHGG